MSTGVFLSDFDRTIVKKDLLDVVCQIVDKEEESIKLNREFQSGKRKGLGTLIDRINLLKGVSIDQIHRKLRENDFLVDGVAELFLWLKKNNVLTILYSGNLESILSYYQEKLNIDYIIGTKPNIENGKIVSISEKNFKGKNFKLERIKKILNDFDIQNEKIVAFGDSPGDEAIFNFAGKSIAINPKGGIEKIADHKVTSPYEVIDIVKKY